MKKPVFGMLLGGLLGIPDGLSALVSAGDDPNVRAGIVGIVIGSTVKGLVSVFAHFFTRTRWDRMFHQTR